MTGPVMPTLLRGDARRLPLADGTVDLVVTSPPYFGLRDYTDGDVSLAGQVGAEATPGQFIAALVACTAEMVRVLKPSGSIFVNLGDAYAAAERGPDGSSSGLSNGAQHRVGRGRNPRAAGVPRKSLMLLPERFRIAAVDELGLIARAVIIWDKPNGMPESVTDRVRRSHEDWVHLTKEPHYFSAVDEIREPHERNDRPRPVGSRNKTPRHTAAADYTGWKDHQVSNHALGKLPGSVWEIATQPLKVPAELGVDHYAAFPMEWPRRLISGWCPPGGVVLDPFGGTGTTALVAVMLGCRGLSLDLSAGYGRIALWRATEPRQRARAAGYGPDAVARLAPLVPAQIDLFEEAL